MSSPRPQTPEQVARSAALRSVMETPWPTHTGHWWLAWEVAGNVDADGVVRVPVEEACLRRRVKLVTVVGWVRRWHREGLVDWVPGQPLSVRFVAVGR